MRRIDTCAVTTTYAAHTAARMRTVMGQTLIVTSVLEFSLSDRAVLVTAMKHILEKCFSSPTRQS